MAKPRPKPVIIATFLSLGFVLLSIQPLVDDISIIRSIPLIFSSLITVGLWRGNRLARQWATLVGGLAGALAAVYVLFTLSGPWQFTILAVLMSALPIAIAILLSLKASNANFGDPAQGIAKKLSVEYTAHGKTTTKTVKEGETIRIIAGTTPRIFIDTLRAALDRAPANAKKALLRVLRSTGGGG